MGVLYLYVRRKLCLLCYQTIFSCAKEFSNSPTLPQLTSESLLDGIDYELLDLIDETRTERADYIRMLHELSESIGVKELFARLGKL